jgi:nicotinate-nucleotide adenylyltransferase
MRNLTGNTVLVHSSGMNLLHKATGLPQSVAVLAGAFNPPTTAHVALAETALTVVDEVILAIPRAFPHKQFEGATLEQRIAMLQRIAETNSRFSVGVAEGGLFVEIAREARVHYPDAGMFLLCGRDAAERIVNWDYGDPEFADKMLSEFGLLVAPRGGEYVAPERFRHAIRSLAPGNYDDCSSTRLREIIRDTSNWQTLVPEVIAEMVEKIYR